MGKPKFSVGELVCVTGYKKHICFFYIYDYIWGQTYPYHIMSLEKNNRVYATRAKNLKSISNVIVLINTILSNSVNITATIEKGKQLKERRHAPNRVCMDPYPLDQRFRREVRYD